jgi:hypothetical protein
MPLENHYLHVKKRFPCTVGNDLSYSIPGTYFRQANRITNVCAHACAVMMLNNSGSISGIVTAEEVNKTLGYDQTTRRLRITADYLTTEEDLPSGLGLRELEGVFFEYGFAPDKRQFGTVEEQKRFRSFIYGFVESGYPALLSFNTHEGTEDEIGHVVPVLGHTLNPHSWFPVALSYSKETMTSAGYLPTLAWIDDLIIHDDVFGMQYCLPAHAFKPECHPELAANFTPVDAMGIFPKSKAIGLLGHDAERIGASVIRAVFDELDEEVFQAHYYLDHLRSRARIQAGGSIAKRLLKNTAVVRSFLIEPRSYIAQLNAGQALSTKHLEFISQALSIHGVLWLVEVTEQDLFVGNRAKVIDVLLDPALELEPVVRPAPAHRESDPAAARVANPGVVLIRLPGLAMVPLPGTQGWREARDLGITSHLPLFSRE